MPGSEVTVLRKKILMLTYMFVVGCTKWTSPIAKYTQYTGKVCKVRSVNWQGVYNVFNTLSRIYVHFI